MSKMPALDVRPTAAFWPCTESGAGQLDSLVLSLTALSCLCSFLIHSSFHIALSWSDCSKVVLATLDYGCIVLVYIAICVDILAVSMRSLYRLGGWAVAGPILTYAAVIMIGVAPFVQRQ
jgi:hypothetical protein